MNTALETAVIGLITSNLALAGLCFHLTRKATRRQATGRTTRNIATAPPSGPPDGQQ